MESLIKRSFLLPALIMLLSGLLLHGCQRFPGQYKPDIEQGNILDQGKLQQVQMGMSQEQVRFLLGNPVMVNALQPQEWIYYYMLKNSSNRIVKRRYLKLQFNAYQILTSKTLLE